LDTPITAPIGTEVERIREQFCGSFEGLRGRCLAHLTATSLARTGGPKWLFISADHASAAPPRRMPQRLAGKTKPGLGNTIE
jgi:hypothetical protein